MTHLEVKKVKLKEELQAIFGIRRKVFVEEQQVDEKEEYDEFEDTSSHFIAIYNSIPVGTARWRFVKGNIKLERFAVLKAYRNKGVATSMLNAVLQDLPAGFKVYLHAQVHAVPFYAKNGFLQEGEMFSEAGIDHYKMFLNGLSGSGNN